MIMEVLPLVFRSPEHVLLFTPIRVSTLNISEENSQDMTFELFLLLALEHLCLCLPPLLSHDPKGPQVDPSFSQKTKLCF